MRVLVVTGYYYPATEWGGPTRSISLLSDATRRAGADLEVVTTTTRGAPDLPTLAPGTRMIRNVPVTYGTAYGPRRFFFSPRLAAEIMRRLPRVDLVHVAGIWTFPVLWVAAACRAQGVPYILSPRGNLDQWCIDDKATKKSLYLRLVGLRILHGAALLHLTAEAEKYAMPERLWALPSAVVPNPVDIETFAGVSPVPPAAESFRMIIAGRIHPKKGFDLLMEALRHLIAGGTPTTLTIAGPDEGGYAHEVRRLATEHGVREHLRFTGKLDTEALARALQDSDVLVMPSYQENFGMSAAEAMAASRPVVVSETVNIAAEIQSSRAGRVVPLAAEAIAKALAELAADPGERRAAGQRGRRLVLEKWSPKAIGKDMLVVYEKVVAAANQAGRARGSRARDE